MGEMGYVCLGLLEVISVFNVICVGFNFNVFLSVWPDDGFVNFSLGRLLSDLVGDASLQFLAYIFILFFKLRSLDFFKLFKTSNKLFNSFT
jgi:hypothetical protein